MYYTESTKRHVMDKGVAVASAMEIEDGMGRCARSGLKEKWARPSQAARQQQLDRDRDAHDPFAIDEQAACPCPQRLGDYWAIFFRRLLTEAKQNMGP